MNPVREQIRSMIQVQPREGGFRALFNVGPELSVLPDHFPNRPILPGICMIQAVLLAGARQLSIPDLRMIALKNAKWLQPIAPAQQVVIEADMTPTTDGDFHIKAKLSAEGKRCAEFSLLARAVSIAEGAPA
jgi:3-hydroxymyristoyl/3-hydroxydecanoyl-(acyl carrier protein) dehydratase